MKKNNILYYSFLIIILTTIACNTCINSNGNFLNSDNNANISVNDSVVTNGINLMAFNLFKNLSHADANLFFSPYSVASSFALIYPGSKGLTKDEIQQYFHFYADAKDNSKLFCALNQIIAKTPDRFGEVNIANALWVQKGYKINSPYLDQVKNYFNSELYMQDFIHVPQESCDAINKWGSDKSNHKIEKIISTSDLSETTRLILTNSIYFNRKWMNEFDKNATQNAVFYNTDKIESTVKMMHMTSYFNYAEDSLLQALEIPYIDDYSMIVLLPKSIQNGFKDIDFNYPNYLKWTTSMSKKEVILSIPKFKLENSLQLSEVLRTNGLITSFTPVADFKGISNENIFIDKCYQNSYITIDEEKTEAVAVGVTFTTAMSAINENPPIVFNMDHPFVFMIFSKKSNTILFLGKVCLIKNES
jgi:serpin B